MPAAALDLIRIHRPDKASSGEVRKSTPECIRLKKASRVKKELGLSKLPAHVEQFGRWMLEQSRRDLGPRDVVKAYVITASSIQRGAITVMSLRRAWPDHPFGQPAAQLGMLSVLGRDTETVGQVRPEDAAAYALAKTRAGQRYLDEAERGRFDQLAARQFLRMLVPFGRMGVSIDGKVVPGDRTSLYAVMEKAVALGEKATECISTLRSGSKGQWYAFARENVYGVGPAKSGFLASLLGRGDIPTADARELQLWWENRSLFASFHEKRAQEFIGGLERRLTQLNIEMPAELRPFYQHLVHHYVWDVLGGEETTHEDVVSCMRLGEVGVGEGCCGRAAFAR